MGGILSIKIRADATPFERSLKTVGRNITSFAQKSLAVGRGISLGFTAPLMAIGATAVNAAADFDSLERALAGIMGGANAAAGEMSKLKEAAKLPGLGFEEAVRGSVNLQAVFYGRCRGSIRNYILRLKICCLISSIRIVGSH